MFCQVLSITTRRAILKITTLETVRSIFYIIEFTDNENVPGIFILLTLGKHLTLWNGTVICIC